ncbi:hypothetical protein DPEC_G00032900 [Dallia pectoralis]|uniref:Uncharacterized protein n=1 Tax=Dallia pectoralis TaxID=75939 RepID=A0ACC2HD98_DALPE|nr:hypothetical protein DPEC_G00032900 [Dallia pectoralis]
METCMSESDFCETTTLRNVCNPEESDAPIISLTSSWNSMEDLQSNTRDSCLSALQSCPKSHSCAFAYKKLKDLCQIGKDKCIFPSSQDSCLSLWMELQDTSLSNCACALWSRKCPGIWRSVINNPCSSKPVETLGLMSSNMRNKLPGNAPQKSLFLDWKASSLKDIVHETGGSCLQQMTICLNDEVCNRWLVPLVEACSARQCNNTHCQQTAQQFYAGLPHNVAQMFVLCGCDPGDQDCLHMKKSLHSGLCEEQLEEITVPICLEVFHSCLGEMHCRSRLEALLTECWDAEDTPCRDYGIDACISYLDFALILGGDPECKLALTATMGSTLQRPCTCEGQYSRDLVKCNTIHELLHNRALFMTPMKKESTSYVPPQMNGSRTGYKWLSDQLLCVFAYVLLVVVVLTAVMIVFHRRIYREHKSP